MVLGSTPADGVRRAPPWQTGGLCLGVSGQLCARAIFWEESAGDRLKTAYKPGG
ncbi:unnamed protein product [Staurois parvus]|uniref:Uncharacterized protein n=1 Tax=Staurois parvus TaxID=386267 RepID=A0ABN9APR9_9NEOB|nr:unnamed protein product [Staurois parvus]